MKYDDLYESEKRIFGLLNLQNRSILDVGCALGGFYNVFKSLDSSAKYTGIDFSESLILEAKNRYPEANFIKMDATQLEFENNSFDIVVCNSVQAHIPNYRSLISEVYRVAKYSCVLDTRLTFQNTQNIGDEDLSYYVLNMGEMFEIIEKLENLQTFVLHSNKITPNKNKLHSKDYVDVGVFSGLFLFEKQAK
ncbi:class I SAM-dependent methyltransferase [Leptospira vanthielii]|nr:class I SAM-dependent methyltransferase [Leptospira vanthielii]